MIGFLQGDFVRKTPTAVLVNVHGVGYEVQISLATYSSIQTLERGTLHTHLLVREDNHTLFGFFDLAEKDLFIHLISVSGVGAATARMMLSAMRPEEIVRGIVQGNTRLLESIKGIGKKSAERIILELKDKLGKIIPESNIPSLIDNTLEQDALNALLALGIARTVAEHALRKVLAVQPAPDKVEDIIKNVLKIL